MSDLLDGLKALDDHTADYQMSKAYYTGDITEAMFNSNALSRRLAECARRFRVNLAKLVVDAVVDRMEIAAVTVPDDETATTALQQEAWDANQLTLETTRINRWACVYGDAYLLVWPGEDESTVEINFNDPTEMRLFYDPENPRRKAYAVKAWWAKDGDRKFRRVNLYYPDRVERWIAKQADTSPERDNLWEPYLGDGGLWPVPNPFGEIPIFHLRTDSPYGSPEHKDAYGPQDAINKIVTTMMAAIEYAGYPLRYALVESGADVNGDASFAQRYKADADAEEGDHDEIDLRTDPDTVWYAKGLKGVGQLDPADPKHFLDPAQFLIRLMATINHTPVHFLNPSGDAPSGESLRTAEAPLIKKVEARQQRFGSTYSEALTFALKVLGVKITQKVDVRWESAASTDDKASWETAGLKSAAGVPGRQILLEQGYVAEQVDEWIAGAEEDSLRQRVALLSDLGRASQLLGAAESLGALEEGAAKRAVGSLLDDVTRQAAA